MLTRPARKDDKGPIVEMLYNSGSEIYDYLYAVPGKTAQEFVRFEYLSGEGFCGYKILTVVVDDEQSDNVLAVACSYDGKEYLRLVFGSLINVFRFYGPVKVWPVIVRMLHTASIMSMPKFSEVYFSNGGVIEPLRGQGIGSKVLLQKINEARDKGYKRACLDVDETNPRAENLYSKYGFKVVKYKKFTGKDARVPNAKEMELML